MDYIVSKEIAEMRNEETAIQEALDAEKFSFKHQLEGDMGKQMMEELANPPKKSILLGLKYKIRRARTIREGKKQERKALKEQKKRGDD